MFIENGPNPAAALGAVFTMVTILALVHIMIH